MVLHTGPPAGYNVSAQGVVASGAAGYQSHTVPGAPGYQTPGASQQPVYMPSQPLPQPQPPGTAAEYQPYNMHGTVGFTHHSYCSLFVSVNDFGADVCIT